MSREMADGAASPASGCTGRGLRAGAGAVRTLAVAAALVAALGARDAAAQNGAAADDLGRRVYESSCADCHRSNGEGIPGVYPALDGDPFVTASAELAVEVVLAGRAPAPDVPQMPRFDDLLSDEEVAAVVSYIRTHWSNDAAPVEAETVASLRSRLAGDDDESAEMPAGWRAEGEELYRNNCAACHQEGGEGADGIFPPLAGNPVVTSAPGPLVHVLLTGRGGMPSFARELDDERLSYIVSYIRTAWGNDASPVSPETVRRVPHPEGER